ncbi:hypothetical protein RhiirA5_291720 [Rhizophagus irregularis]|uniref:Ciga protein n=1 Tax=Rhizophagus irregularis TaxID=588596 RepID=A0A2N0PLU6_9GLOM|nr:hypothetical protein RhiirA5_291720 [Rhizophagus irregularis]
MGFFYTLLKRLPAYDLDDSNIQNILSNNNNQIDNYNKPPTTQSTKKFLDVEVKENIDFNINPEEKFLAYFTHSGYHNQRISLENALLLSKLLNRTLLLPPVLLGPPVPWARFDKLYERLFLTTKNGLEHCVDISRDYPLPIECLNYYAYTTVSWGFLINMNPIREWNKIIDRWDHSFEWLEIILNINKDNDIHFIKDTTLWDYRIYDKNDMDNTILTFDKYKRKLRINDLNKIEKKVLHLGSLFGSFRVLPEKDDSKEYLKFIRKQIIPHNPILKETSNNIVEKLGGEKNFIGLHIRVSDGFFMKTARINIDNIYHEIINNFTNFTPEEIDKLEGGTHDQDILEDESVDLGDDKPLSTQVNKKKPIPTKIINNNNNNNNNFTKFSNKINGFSNKVNCKNPLHSTDQGANTVIYIATDAKDPRNNPLLFKFFNTFPCVFVLDDFEQELINLKSVRNIHDKTPLASYLIPMLDSIISAKGFKFIGTPKSTFSTYIDKTLHPIYTGEDLIINITP